LRPAGVTSRSYAFLIDALLRGAVLIAASSVLSAMSQFGTGLFLVLLFAVEWLYPVLFELLPGAATPGKRALGLQVLMDTGLPVTPAASMTRNLLRAADFLPFGFAAGLASMMLRSDFKRLGDIVAGTLVVHRERVRRHGALPAATALAPPRPLSRPQQVAVLRLAGRSAHLTLERLDELAVRAQSVLPAPVGETARPGARLLALAQWLAGPQ